MSFRSTQSLRRLWVSLFDTCDYSTVHEDDLEAQGVVLLAHSIVTIFKRVQKDQKSTRGKLDLMKQELESKQKQYESSQVELQAARQKCCSLEKELTRMQAVKPLCQNCPKLKSTTARLQERMNLIVANIARIAHAPSAESLQSYMTQVIQGDDPPIFDPQALETPSSKQVPEPASPDIIEKTPDPPKREKRLRRPDGCKKKAMKNSLKISPPSNEEELPIISCSILVKDTEDMDATLNIKPVLRENTIIPASFTEITTQSHDKTFCGKENQLEVEPRAVSPGEEKLLMNLSTDVPFPVTPPKPIRAIVGSPVLGGSGCKKSNHKSARHTNCSEESSPSLLGVSKIPTLFLSPKETKREAAKKRPKNHLGLRKDGEVHYEERNGVLKKMRQRTLHSFPFNEPTTDVSHLPEFSGGQRKISDLEEQCDVYQKQLDQALKESLKTVRSEQSSIASEQADTTIFTPPEWNVQKKGKGDIAGSSYAAGQPIGRKDHQVRDGIQLLKKCSNNLNNESLINNVGNETFFNPDCASTAKENLSVTSSFNPKSSECQFNPVYASTMRTDAEKLQRDIPGTPFDPPLASTPNVTQNPELAALVQRLDTSYDRLPRKGPISPEYAYRRDAVRNKNDRKQLPGWDCRDCQQFYEAAGYDANDYRLKKVLNKCSRHRDKFGIRPPSPKGFWDPGFPSTQSLLE